MSTEITRLHGSTSADLLAIPAIMLGFHPLESCVVLGIRGTRVEFCARMDLDWFTSDFRFGEVADQLQNAIARCTGGCVAVLAYTSDPEAGALALEELQAVVGEDLVAEALVSDGERFWYAHTGLLLPPEGVPYSYASSSFAAQAVYCGVSVDACRERAVEAVQPPEPSSSAAVTRATGAAREKLAAMTPAERMELLARHLGESTPRHTNASELAVLLQEEEHFGEVLVHLGVDTAQRLRPRLAQARRVSEVTLAPNVLALLTLACWLDGEGAQQSDCLTQLEALDRHHPLLGVLRVMHNEAVPPGRWDA